MIFPPLDIAVLATGSELLSGELSDTNSAAIARCLAGRGLGLKRVLVVGDREADIAEALAELARCHQVVIVTGGLGPTADDLTARAAARAGNRRLVLNEEALQQIRQYFRMIGRQMHPGNEKQALLPQKCRVLPNRRGTAPGFHLTLAEADLYFLPGVPEEMQAMLEEAVLPELEKRSGGELPLQQRTLKVFALAEPRIQELLAQVRLPDSVELAFGLDFPLVLVKLRAGGGSAGEALDRAELVARQALGDYVVAVEGESFAGNVGRQLDAAGLTVALAESCTGGMLAQLLTDEPGASSFFERGAVTYANSAKQDWLKVPENILAERGAVSEVCAQAMARGVRAAARADIGLAITGIAGPDGGTPEKPVGTVFIAIDAADLNRVQGYHFGGDRRRIRVMSSYMALDWLRRYAISRLQAVANRAP